MDFQVYLANDQQENKWLNGASLRERPGIAAYLVGFDAGRTATPECPEFFVSLDSTGVMNLGVNTLKSLSKTYPRMAAYDLTRTEKYGPQGWIYPLGSDEMIAKIQAYYAAQTQCRPSPKALRAFRRFAENADLTPYTYEETLAREYENTGLRTNSGFPLFTKRKKCMSETVELATRAAQTRETYPAVLGARSIKNKMRLIFMAPFEQNLRELSYVYAIMDYLIAHAPQVRAWVGQDDVTEAINRDFLHSNTTYLSTDFTAMDTTVGESQIRLLAEVLPLFFRKQYREELRTLLIQSFTQEVVVGSVTQPGAANVSRNRKRLMYLSGKHGLFSGLGFTNLAETVLQLILDLDLADSIPIIAAQVNGDDGIKAIDGRKWVDHAAEAFSKAASRYGFVSNVSKQFVSNDEIHYLQRVYSPETVRDGLTLGAYPLMLTLNSAKNPERDRGLVGFDQAARLISIFNNAWTSPYVDESMQMLIAGNSVVRNWLETGEGAREIAESARWLISKGETVSSVSNADNRFAQQGDSLDIFNKLPIVRLMTQGGSALLKDATSHYGAWM